MTYVIAILDKIYCANVWQSSFIVLWSVTYCNHSVTVCEQQLGKLSTGDSICPNGEIVRTCSLTCVCMCTCMWSFRQGYNNKVIVGGVELAAESPCSRWVSNHPEVVTSGGVPQSTGPIRRGRHNEVIGNRPIKIYRNKQQSEFYIQVAALKHSRVRGELNDIIG